jgi:hypothetical protein
MPQNEMPEVRQDTFEQQPEIPRPRYSTAWAVANRRRDGQANAEARFGMKRPLVRGRLWPQASRRSLRARLLLQSSQSRFRGRETLG